MPFTLTFCRPQRESLALGSGILDSCLDLAPSQAMGSRPPLLTPPYSQHQEMLGPHEGSDLVPELVLVLPQQDGDRAIEVSAESSITEGFPASGLEKQKRWTRGPGWPGILCPGASVPAGLSVFFGD